MVNLSKGNIPIPLIVIFFITIFMISLMVIISDKVNSEFQDATADTFNQTMLNQTSKTLQVFDSGVPFIFMMFMLATMLIAWSLRSNPVMALVLIMVVGIVAIVGASISNTFYDVARSDSLVANADKFDLIVFLNENYPLFLIVLGFAIIIFTFAKPKAELF